jgi:hypothetical protein
MEYCSEDFCEICIMQQKANDLYYVNSTATTLYDLNTTPVSFSGKTVKKAGKMKRSRSLEKNKMSVSKTTPCLEKDSLSLGINNPCVGNASARIFPIWQKTQER